MNPRNKKLLALTTAALALPGMAPKALLAQTAPEEFSFGYRYSKYEEADQPAATVSDGQSVQRYEIDIHQVGVVIPVSSSFSVNVDALTETMTGASPWYVTEGDDGDPVQILSGASIDENRNDIGLTANYFSDRFRVSAGVARSEENDYESLSQNVSASFSFNNNNTSIDIGASRSDDDIEPTRAPAIDPNRVFNETKDSKAFSIGFSQVMSKTLLVGGGFSYTRFDGFLSDPYKLASVNGALLRDNRPDSKNQTAVEFRVRKFLPNQNAAVHADYRFFDNDWGNSSHTLSLGWYQNLGSWQLSARVRGYNQTSTNFFRNFYTEERVDGFYSSDYRLSSYGALSLKLGIRKSFEKSSFSVSFEDYKTGKGFSDDGDLSPGLVEFQVLTAGFDFRF